MASSRPTRSTRRTSTPAYETPPRRAGFTLVELLTVLAVIGLLTAILIPSTSTARVAAKRAKTRVQFSQWAAAMELFRQEYGYYPAIDGGSGGKVVPGIFAGALTGRSVDGLSPATAGQLAGNARQLRFYHMGESELNGNRTELADGFGNTDLAVIYDKNGDGIVGTADGAVTSVHGLGQLIELAPGSDDLNLSTGVRAGVIFYSAGQGRIPSDLVFSWK